MIHTCEYMLFHRFEVAYTEVSQNTIFLSADCEHHITASQNLSGQNTGELTAQNNPALAHVFK